MRRRFVIIAGLLIAVAMTATAVAEAPAVGPLSGVICYPEGSTEETATYVYRYSYPLLSGDSDAVAAINENYAYMVYDAESFQVPITGESVEYLYAGQGWTNVIATVTCHTEEIFSVLVETRSDLGDGETLILSSQTYPLTGNKAGSVTSLPYMLGILERSDEADEWLEERQAAKAQACVQGLVWELVQDMQGDFPFYEGLTEERLNAVFYPEDDFYINADGDYVFYIEPGTLAPEEAGALQFTISKEDILDEL